MGLVSRPFDQLIDFTRTSAATYVDATGKIVITPASKNIFTFTQEFANAAWTKTGVTVTPNTIAAPDGTLTADTITATAGTSNHLLNSIPTNLSQFSRWMASIYVKRGNHNFVQILHSSNAAYFANFDILNLTVGTKGNVQASIVDVGNGWLRLTLAFVAAAASSIRFAFVTSSTAVYNESWTAAGTETMYVWGAQAEITSDTNLNLGPELITNGSFIADANWTKGTGWSIGSGVATKAAGSAGGLSQLVALEAGSVYRITFTATRSAGTLTPRFIGGTISTAFGISASGTYTMILPALTGNTTIDFSADASFAGTIDNILVSKIVDVTPTSYTRNFGGLFPARFDYDPVTLSPKGLLIEEQRTNLLIRSEDFVNSTWAKTNITVTAAATTSPDGTLDAQKIEATATTAATFTSTPVAVNATSATFSVYVKQGSSATIANTFILRNTTTSTNLVGGTLNFSTGVWTYTIGSTGAIVTNAGNGWWRVQITAAAGITSGNNLMCYVGFSGAAQTAGNHLFAWGAQLEAGIFATSYIPTTDSQITRTSDQPSINSPNVDSWYNQSEGTLYAEFDVLATNTVSECVAALSDGTSSNIFLPFVNSTGVIFVNTISGGVTSANVNAGQINVNNVVKIASSYRLNDFAASRDGVVPTIDTSGNVPVNVSMLNIGWSSPYGGLFLNGHIRSLKYYPTRLPNSSLQALSK